MTDDRLEQVVGNLLRIGVTLAAAVVLAGGMWYLAAEGTALPDYKHYHDVRDAMPWRQGWTPPLQTIEIGLLILIATPVARVVFSLVMFGMERDRAYVWITLIVLMILAYSLTA
jgi:uncharacterized membrane protein